MSASAAPLGAEHRPAESSLQRRLGPLDGAAIVVSNVIGGSIFFLPVIIAGLVPSGWAMLGVWLFGGVLAFTGAMAYAELAALRPHAGGEYVYLREAFGRGAAFLTGWTSFVAGFSGAIAVTAVAMCDYLGRFPFAAAAGNKTVLLTIPVPYLPLTVTPQALVAILVIAILTGIHLGSTGRLVHNLLAGLKVSALVVFIVVGLTLGAGSFSNVASTHQVASPATGWLLALIPVMFAYSGWNAAAYVAEEIRNPGRNVPLALGIGTLAVVAIYLALNVLYFYAMPIAELAGLQRGLTDTVAERLFGVVAGNLIAAFTIVSIAASISAMVLAGPRVYYAMARDGVFLAAATKVHPRHRTPVLALVAQAVWASVLVLCGTLSQLVNYTGFAVVLFAGIAVLSLFVLRWREPNAVRPFRAVGYPLAPALFVLASLAMVINEIWNNPGSSLVGLGVILSGVPIYLVYARRGRVSPSA